MDPLINFSRCKFRFLLLPLYLKPAMTLPMLVASPNSTNIYNQALSNHATDRYLIFFIYCPQTQSYKNSVSVTDIDIIHSLFSTALRTHHTEISTMYSDSDGDIFKKNTLCIVVL